MPLLDIFRAVRDQTSDQRNSFRANNEKLGWRFMEVLARMWDLGFTVGFSVASLELDCGRMRRMGQHTIEKYAE